MTIDQATHSTSTLADHAVAQDPISHVQDSSTADDAASTGKGLAPAALSLLGAALLAACGGGGGGATSNSAPGFNNFPTASNDNEAARFLLQGQLSASDAEISTVRGGTFADYLQQQYAKPPGQTGWDWLESRGYGVSDKRRYFFNTYPADFMIWNQLFTLQDSLRKRVALALSEFFVASLQSAEFNWRSHAYAQYWDLLVQNAFGNYRQLLEDVTLNPAMGDFLNTKGNQKEDGKGRLPDENYGREVMQLFSIGLYQLNLDGTEKTGANGKKLESYTQDDVTNIARTFTGYDYDNAVGKQSVNVVKDDGGLETYKLDSRESVRRRMLVDPKKHSTLAASFLGATVPADPKGESGPAALKIALDTLFNHPNVGPFFGKQMIQRLVTSNPSPAYVARVASAFNNDGEGVRGNLRAVWTAVLLDDEARNPQNAADPNFGKLREPMLRFVQWGRSFGLSSAAGSWKLFETTGAADKLGQSPLRSPSVFNFFRPGFVPPSTALANTMSPAPEFQIVNETTVGGYLNYMQNVIRNGFEVPEADLPYQDYKVYTKDIVASYARELELVGDAAALVKRINLVMCAGQLSGSTQTIIINALNATPLPPSTATPDAVKNAKLDRISAAVLLTMASPEYLVQK
jgi:uncharacterized protein (DUF1800 family)